jgi:hypothetical protein
MSGEQKIILNDLNLRSLVSIAMHLNPSTNNKVGHLFQGHDRYCYTVIVHTRVSISPLAEGVWQRDEISVDFRVHMTPASSTDYLPIFYANACP